MLTIFAKKNYRCSTGSLILSLMQILNTPSNLIRSNSRGVSIKKAAFLRVKTKPRTVKNSEWITAVIKNRTEPQNVIKHVLLIQKLFHFVVIIITKFTYRSQNPDYAQVKILLQCVGGLNKLLRKMFQVAMILET